MKLQTFHYGNCPKRNTDPRSCYFCMRRTRELDERHNPSCGCWECRGFASQEEQNEFICNRKIEKK